jgi:RimJ/RimL family protein N-acetyltransferase
MPNILTTDRLFLRAVSSADIDILWAIWREPAVRRYLFDDIPVARERATEIVTDMMALANDGLGMWTVRLRNTSAAIGCAGLLRAGAAMVADDPQLRGSAEVVVALTPSAWHHGYAQEALRAVLEHAFVQLQLPQVCAMADVPNDASVRLVSRLGFVPAAEGEGPKHRLCAYVLTRAAWRNGTTDQSAAC